MQTPNPGGPFWPRITCGQDDGHDQNVPLLQTTDELRHDELAAKWDLDKVRRNPDAEYGSLSLFYPVSIGAPEVDRPLDFRKQRRPRGGTQPISPITPYLR